MRYSGSSARSTWAYIPPDVTSSTRAPRALARSAGRSSSVISTGPQHVHGHRQLVPLCRLGALRRHHPGVVDEDVQPGATGEEVGGEPAYVVQVADVAPVHLHHCGRRRRADPGHHALGLRLVAHHQVHPGAEGRDADRRRQPEARGRTGDRHVATGQRPRPGVGRPARQPRARGQADLGEAEHHGPVEHGVDGPTDGGQRHAGGLRVEGAEQLVLRVVGELLEERRQQRGDDTGDTLERHVRAVLDLGAAGGGRRDRHGVLADHGLVARR